MNSQLNNAIITDKMPPSLALHLSVNKRKKLAKACVANYGFSIRQACKLFNLSRTAYYYDSEISQQHWEEAETRLIELTKRHPQYGYWKLYNIMREEGYMINHKRVYRIYKQWRHYFCPEYLRL